MSVILISHDMGVIAEFAQRVVVMYAGRVVETAPVKELFRKPVHPYTEGLLAAIPKLDDDVTRLPTIRGSIPDPAQVIPGLPFRPACPGCHGSNAASRRRPSAAGNAGMPPRALPAAGRRAMAPSP